MQNHAQNQKKEENAQNQKIDMRRMLQKKRKKKEENNISSMETYQMPNKWQYLTCIKVSFSNQNLQNDIVTPRL